MEEAALAISICAFVLAAAGFGWTIFEWNRSGARIKVGVTSLALLPHPLAPSTRWMIALDLANAGRTATTVTSVGFLRPDGGVLLLSEPAVGPNPLPARIEPGDSITYPVDIDDLITECKAHALEPAALRPYARTGHGQFKGRWKKVALDMLPSRMAGADNSGG